MEVLVFIILVIITILIVIVLVRVLIDISKHNNNGIKPSKIGEACNVTSDCSLGLTCDQSMCLIPITGSCVNMEDKCSQGGVCSRGMCINNLEVSTVPMQTISPTVQKGDDPSATYKMNEEGYNKFTFHFLTSTNSKIQIPNKNIIDASFDISSKSSPKTGFMWYLTTNKEESKTNINVTDYSGATVSTPIAKGAVGVSCQAFGRICYVLVKQPGVRSAKKTNNVQPTSVFAMQKFTLTSTGTIKVEYPTLPKHDDVQRCINLGISDKGVIMIVTEDSNISFNINSLNEDVSSWYLSPRDNRGVLYMSYINGTLFSFTQEDWYYGITSGERSAGTYPVVVNNVVENKKYWSKPGLKLSEEYFSKFGAEQHS